ncbi:Molybdopterin guanine dinucleotide synthesis protein B [uncultured archaeon]|nr:Molybdopterin guanine dinucleotide synthesis protein B [uncultured archaeon]
MTPVICIVGKSKNDKTKLIEALIKGIKSRGIKVGALKHHKHGDFEIDIKGKDTWKYANEGADTVAISSSVKFAMIKNVDKEIDLDEICDKYFADIDIVLADGFTLSDKPRIIVADNVEDVNCFSNGCTVVAVVSKAGSGFDNVDDIVNRVVNFFGAHNP